MDLRTHAKGRPRRAAAFLASALLVVLAGVATPSTASARTAPSAQADATDVPDPDTKPQDESEERRVVVVTGTRTPHTIARTPVTTQVISREELDDSGAEDLSEALEEQNGVAVTRSFAGAEIRIRGFDPSQTLILVDGQRTTGRIGGAIDLRRFSLEGVDAIEIVKGPASVLYGADAMGGVVNIRTAPPLVGPQAQAHLSYGSRNTADLTGRAGYGWKRFRFLGFGGFHHDDGWDADPSDEATTGNALEAANFGGLLYFGGRRGFSMKTRGEYLHRQQIGVDQNAALATFDRRSLTEVVSASALPEVVFGSGRFKGGVHYTLFRDQFASDQRGSSELDQYQDTYDQLGNGTAQYDAWLGRHTLTLGVDLLSEWLNTGRIEPSDVTRQRYAAFVQEEWDSGTDPELVLIAGARVDYDTMFGVYGTPRVAAMVSPVEPLAIRFGYGRAFRAPSFREMYLLFSNPSAGYVVQGNPNLKPEQSWGLDLSVTYEPISAISVEASVFDNQLRDLIVIDTIDEADADSPSLFGYENIGSARIQGLELSSGFDIAGHADIAAGYTYLHTEDLENHRPLPGRAKHQVTFSAGVHPRGWGTSLRVRGAVFGRRPFYSDADGDGVDQTTFVPDFASVDVRLSQSLLRYLELFLGVDNVTGAGDADLNPLRPRTYYGGLTVRFDRSKRQKPLWPHKAKPRKESR